MRPAGQSDFHHLRFLIENKQQDLACRLLAAPDHSFLPGLTTGPSVKPLFQNLEKTDPVLADFIRLRLLSEFFLFPERRRRSIRDWLKQQARPTRFFPESDFDRLAEVRWLAVPVGVVSAERSRLYYFVCGLDPTAETPILPAWAERLLDGEVLRTIQIAVQAAAAPAGKPATGLIVYPLLPDRGEIQITGDSFGLPLAMGILSLLTNQPINPDLAMTGAVSADGSIAAVGEVTAKFKLFQEKQFPAVFYPAANGAFPVDENQARIPVSSLHQARIFCNLYSPANAEKLQLFQHMLQDSRFFVSNADNMPPDWLDLARDHNWAEKTISAVLNDPGLFLQLTEKLVACADRFQIPQGRAISRFAPLESLPAENTAAPLAAFKWCTANLSLANHQGQVQTAQNWAARAQTFLPRALAADINAVATFYNHYLVAQHNRYAFTPELPDDLSRTLSCLEAQHRSRCLLGNRAFMVLGRLFGTLVQHYAFCGPAFLEQVEAYSQKARQALGEDSVPEYKNEWMRQYSYLTCALLSAGQVERAATGLLQYLEIPGWEALPSRLNRFSPWQHALLARFLADSDRPELCRPYLESVQGIAPEKIDDPHPWQLWYLNMGRIALSLKNKESATTLFSKSLDLCRLPTAGPTIHVMALMPLSFLQHLKQTTAAETRTVEQQIRAAAAQLDRNHFNLLHENKFAAVLPQIRQHPETLFPFSYR